MYHVEYTSVALKQLAKLLPDIQNRIFTKANALAVNSRPHGCKKLVGRHEWRIAISDWRVIYEIHDKVLLVKVIRVSHRSSAYR